MAKMVAFKKKQKKEYKKERVWKLFLFGKGSKPVLPLIKYPWTGLARRRGRRKRISDFSERRSFSCEMQMERMVTLSQLMCSNWSMWDALTTSSAAVNKRSFHSSLGPVAVTASATGVVTCQWTSDSVAQESDVHRLSPADISSVRVISVFGRGDWEPPCKVSSCAPKVAPKLQKRRSSVEPTLRWILRAADRVATLEHVTFGIFQNAHQSPVRDCWS